MFLLLTLIKEMVTGILEVCIWFWCLEVDLLDHEAIFRDVHF